MDNHERMARGMADCLKAHLHEMPGVTWRPYRYPNGEHKGIVAEFCAGYSRLDLIGEDGSVVTVIVAESRRPILRGEDDTP